MNTEIKVNLNITLQGRVMLSQEEAKTLEKQNLAGFSRFSMQVADADGKNKEVINVSVRNNRTVNQSLNISKESYNYMISSECPYWAKPVVWKNLSLKERLELHLQNICEGLRGISYNYQVFED